MDWAAISASLALLNVFLTIALLLALKRLANDIPHTAANLVKDCLNDVGPEISEQITEALKSVAGSVLAKRSAASRSLKAAEREMLTDVVNEQFPGAGTFAAKYIQKYPFLLNILQGMANKAQSPKKTGPGQRQIGKM